MDKQGRITGLNEFREGMTVIWSKGKSFGDKFCVKTIQVAGQGRGAILMRKLPDGPDIWFWPEQWRKRFKVTANIALSGANGAKAE